MKNSFRNTYAIICLLFSAIAVYGQEALPGDRIAVPFSDPSRPGVVEVSVLHGGITVKGYSGKEVIVEAQVRTREYKHKEKSSKKAEGLRRLAVNTTGLVVEEHNNVMQVETSSHQRTIDLMIQVPTRTSLKLNCVNDGDIKAEDISGEIEVQNVNGAVTLSRISGAAIAHALNDDVIVTFVKVDPAKPMSFSSLNGDIDVTFPADLRANIKFKAENGDIYSDFEMKMEPTTQRIEEGGKGGGKYRLRIEQAMQGKINGGGPEINFETLNGDVYVRKGK